MAPSTPSPPPRNFQTFADAVRIYSCMTCHAFLARHDDLISKGFTGRHGRAYLFNAVENVKTTKEEERVLLTGLHSVADIFCNSCQTPIGWKYVYAFEETQKYKEGKYIIEKARIAKENQWDND